MTDRRPVLARTVALLGASGCGRSAQVEALTVLHLPGGVGIDPALPAALAATGAQVLCVAADVGVTDETRAWASLLHALGLRAGAVIVTCADLASSSAAACAQAARALDGVADDAGVLVTSAREGLDPSALVDVLGGGPRRTRALDAAGPPVLHVEEVEVAPGAGTAVTGGLLRGTLRTRMALRVLPPGHAVTVGTLSVRDEFVTEAVAGERVTVRLDDAGPGHVLVGAALVGPDATVRSTRVLDVALADGVRPDHGATVTLHAGARAVAAEVGSLGGRFHQLRCEDEVLVAAWDRVVLCDVASRRVLGGGDVLDPGARRHGPSRDVLADLARAAREGPV
ncbi:hypothetical protein [Paraconexibacter sp.]|uniref:hypothetical protein n=1 Tax=Paraconexibacter sp. TaxID=2949640 RepID=UPI0035644C15